MPTMSCGAICVPDEVGQRRSASASRCRGARDSRRGRTRTAGRRGAALRIPRRKLVRIGPRRRRLRHRVDLEQLERLDVLRLAVLPHLEIFWLEVGDRLALLVGDDDVHADEVDVGAERRLLRLIAAPAGRAPAAAALAGSVPAGCWRRRGSCGLLDFGAPVVTGRASATASNAPDEAKRSDGMGERP